MQIANTEIGILSPNARADRPSNISFGEHTSITLDRRATSRRIASNRARNRNGSSSRGRRTKFDRSRIGIGIGGLILRSCRNHHGRSWGRFDVACWSNDGLAHDWWLLLLLFLLIILLLMLMLLICCCAESTCCSASSGGG